MTSIEEEMVPTLRLIIGDNEKPYMYTNEALRDYIVNSISSLRIVWEHDYTVDKENYTIEPEVKDSHQILFSMEAKLQILNTKPSTSFRTGSLTVTRKDDNKKRLEKKINKAIRRLKLNQGISFLRTEFD